VCVLGGMMLGCDDKNQTEFSEMTMRKEPRYDTQSSSTFFANGMSARPAVVNAVEAGKGAPTRPPITAALLARGQERFQIYCNMCHGNDGYGNGMVVQHGFPQPPSFHSDRVRNLSDEYIHDVISNGRGKMPPYGDQIPDADRWAIISYVRALQRSQHATLKDVPASEVGLLKPAQTEGAAVR
jgi:mono/diheme cytochrome c family protein